MENREYLIDDMERSRKNKKCLISNESIKDTRAKKRRERKEMRENDRNRVNPPPPQFST